MAGSLSFFAKWRPLTIIELGICIVGLCFSPRDWGALNQATF